MGISAALDETSGCIEDFNLTGPHERPNEATPLLPGKVQDTRVQEKVEGGHNIVGDGSVASAVFNLSNTIIGAGIMGLPGTFKVLGIPLGLTALILVGVISEYALQRTLKCTMIAKAWSFEDLMSETYGEFGRALLRGIILVNNLGILIIYFILIGDVLSGVNDGEKHFAGLFEEWGGGPQWWNSRTVVLLSCVVFFIGPLVSLEHIDSLKFSSLLSILLAVVFVSITIVVTVWNFFAGKIRWGELKLLPRLGSRSDVWELFSIIPTMATAFTCLYNLHPILVELKPPREEKMRVAMKSTLFLCTSVYCITALFGYMLFGESTNSDVLANFDKDLGIPYSKVLNDAVRLLYAIHLLLVFPVIHYSLRSSFDAMAFPQAEPLSQSRPRFILVTVLLVGGIFLVSIAIPRIQFAFEFTGAIGAATLALTLPGLIALSAKGGAATASARDTILAWLLLSLGLLVTATGLAKNIYSIVQAA